MRNDRMFWERFRNAYPIKATALLLIAALGFLSCGGREVALKRSFDRLNYDSLSDSTPRPRTPADKLHAASTDLRNLLAIQARRDLSPRQSEQARDARTVVEAQVATIQRDFDIDRVKLRDLGASDALERLDEIETKTKALSTSLRAALALVPETGAQGGKRAATAAQVLGELSPEQPSQPLSSNFGFGPRDAQRSPASLSAGVAPAYLSPTASDQPSGLAREPEPADLAETPETTITPAISSLASRLDHDPVRIFAYVRNTIRYEPYYGIRKGADQTLAMRAGSDADQAALLVALLRESGIHARFVEGVSQLGAQAAANWLGVDTEAGERLAAAPDILASGGIPTTQLRANGQLTAIRFNHVWAEAYVSAEAYRGVDETLGERSWAPLDPSIKPQRFIEPELNLTALLDPIAQDVAAGFVDGSTEIGNGGVLLPTSGELSDTLSDARSSITSILEQQEISSETDVAEVLGGSNIVPLTAPYLPSSLAANTLSVTAEHRAIPTRLTARVSFAVNGADPFSYPEEPGDEGFTYTAPTTSLADQRVTLAYVPATEEDAEIIDEYHGLLNAPSYASSLIPVLRVDGRVVARGRTAVSTGYTQSFTMTYRTPGYAADVVENPVYVGSLSAIGLDLGTIVGSQLKARAHALGEVAPSIDAQNVLTDAHGGELLSELASMYFLRNDAYNGVLSRAAGIHQTRDVSGAIVATSIAPRYLGSFPVSVRLDGLTIDVDQDSQIAVDKRADGPTLKEYLRLSGTYASSSEAAIFEHVLGWEGASTTRAIRAAGEAGIPLRYVTDANVDTELEQLQLPSEVEDEIARAVQAPGVEVITPAGEVTVGSWRGVGYVITEGLGTSYRISGGLSGGAAAPGGSQTVQAALAAKVDSATKQIEEASDCDYREIVIMAIAAIVMLLVVLAILALLSGAGVPFITVELLAFGMAIDAPYIAATAGPALAAAFAALIAAEEYGECRAESEEGGGGD